MSDQIQTCDLRSVNGKKVRLYSLVFITKIDPDTQRKKVLLGLKKRGKLAPDETMDQCAKREVFEECSLTVENLEKIAILVYDFIDSEMMEVHFYHTDQYTGTVQESEEMAPKWFDVTEVPFDFMWLDDRFWFPYFLSGGHFNGYFKFKSNDEIVYKHLAFVDNDKEIEPIYGEIEPVDESV